MPAAVFTEWLNANASRNYPIIEGLGRTDKSGSFTIPNDLILSMQVNFSRDEVDGSFYIKEIGSFLSSCYVVVGYHDGQQERTIAKVAINYSEHVPSSYYPFVGQREMSHVVGTIAIGEVDELKKSGFGVFTFDHTQTEIEPNCLFVSIPALKAVEVYNGNSLIHIANDTLRLRAGENVRLTYVATDDPNNPAIRIDAIRGLNLDDQDQCDNAPFISPGCIKTINGIGPDENNNFNILGSDCISIEEHGNGIIVKDLCSQSCCGCDELNELIAGLEALKAQEEALRSIIDSVQAQQAELISNLASNVI